MKRLHRFASGMLVAALMALAAASGAVTPARAASHTIYVDNTGHCKNALPTISDALLAAGSGPAKIVVCKGTYSETVAADSVHNLTLVARKGVTVTPPTTTYGMALIMFSNSTNVTVQGFTLDGAGKLGPGAMGIWYTNTSGKINHNTLNHWVGGASGIAGSASVPLTLKITANTVSENNNIAVYLSGPWTPTITGNKLYSSVSGSTGIRTWGQAGGKISGNKLSNVAYPTSNGSVGIAVWSSNGVVIAGNRLAHFDSGIDVEAICAGGFGHTASGNKINRNRIDETAWPILVSANGIGCAADASSNAITGNRMKNLSAPGLYPVMLNTLSSGGTASADFEVVKGNSAKGFFGDLPHLAASGAGAAMPTGVFSHNKVSP